MKTLWIIEDKAVKYDKDYSPATFGGVIAAFPTRKIARKRIAELKTLETSLNLKSTPIKYRAVKYVRAE